jgi:hypothetical protein
VFKYDWLVVFIDYDTKEKTVVINSKEDLERFYTQHSNDIFCGYNSRTYDQVIFKAILSGIHPWTANVQIINEGKKAFQILGKNGKIPFNNYDCLLLNKSLKQLEGFLNSKIQESSVDFNIDRHLTQSEIDETIEYCTHDVEQTMIVFDNTKEEFDAQLSLIETFDLPMSSFGKTKAQLVAEILEAVRYEGGAKDEFDIVIPDTLILGEKYSHISDWYLNPKNHNYSRKLYADVAGCPHVFGYGGIHGALPGCVVEGDILACDVASLYPSIIIEYGFMSRGVANVDKYREIRDTRIQLKKVKDPRQLPMKIVLNSCYGTFKDEYNALFDPRQSNNVCVTGQLLILDLIEKLEPYVTILQSNTDGIFMKLNEGVSQERVIEVGKEWEQRTRLTLEWDRYVKLVQKDVNNYILIDSDGGYKSKGAYLKKLSPIDSDLLICNKALIDYFVHGTPIYDTVHGSRALSDFQKIVKVTSLYSHALHGEEKIKEKVLRVFASKYDTDPGLFKIKIVDGTEKKEKIGNTPDHCFIVESDINGVDIPEKIDLEYYISMINERLSDFYAADRATKIKQKSEIKGINEETYNRFMDIDLDEYATFTSFLISVKDSGLCNKTVVKILIELGFLSKFGSGIKLLKLWEAFYEEIKYSSTASENSKAAKEEALICLEEELRERDFTEKEKLLFRKKYTGTFVTNLEADRKKLLVREVGPVCRKSDGNQFGHYAIAKSLGSGKETRYTIKNATWKRCGPVKSDDLVLILGYEHENGFFNMTSYSILQ